MKLFSEKGKASETVGKGKAMPGASYALRMYWVLFLIALMLYFIGLFEAVPRAIGFILHVFAALLAARNLFFDIYRSVRSRFVLNEKPLMALAIVLSFLIGRDGQGAALALLYSGVTAAQELMSAFVRASVRKRARKVASRVTVRLGDGDTVIPLEQVQEGMILIIAPNQTIPVDGLIVGGNSPVDASLITGSAARLTAEPGMELSAGCVNLGDELRVRASRSYGESLLGKLDEICENAAAYSEKVEKRISSIITFSAPVLAGLVIVFGFIVPIFSELSFKEWLNRAIVLLASAGVAGAIAAVPVAYYVSVMRARRSGMIIKSNDALEDLAAVRNVYFGKTGVITDGRFRIVRTVPVGVSEEMLLKYAAYALSCSNHPGADTVLAAYGSPVDSSEILRAHDQQGKGVVIQFKDKTVVCAGNEQMMASVGAQPAAVNTGESALHLTLNRTYIGYILLEDGINLQAEDAVRRLGAMGLTNVALITSERAEPSEAAAQRVGITRVFAGLQAGSAPDKLTALMARQKKRERSLYVGRGNSDTGMIAAANVGVKIAGIRPEQSFEAARAAILPNDLTKVSELLNIARENDRLLKLTFLIAGVVKLAVIVLGLFGILSGWTAPLADLLIAAVTMALCWYSAQDRQAAPARAAAAAADGTPAPKKPERTLFSRRSEKKASEKEEAAEEEFLDIQRAIEQGMDDMPDIPAAPAPESAPLPEPEPEMPAVEEPAEPMIAEEPDSEPEFVRIYEPKTKPAFEPEPAPVTEAALEPESVSEPEPVSEPEAAPEAEPVPEKEPELFAAVEWTEPDRTEPEDKPEQEEQTSLFDSPNPFFMPDDTAEPVKAPKKTDMKDAESRLRKLFQLPEVPEPVDPVKLPDEKQLPDENPAPETAAGDDSFTVDDILRDFYRDREQGRI